MRRRFIAALLLLNLLSWANSAAFCLSGLATMATHAAKLANAQPSHKLLHPCCPRVQANPATDSWTRSQSYEPGHRCCFVQNPQIPSTLPGRSEVARPNGQVAAIANNPDEAAIPVHTLATVRAEAFRPNSAFSVVLRI